MTKDIVKQYDLEAEELEQRLNQVLGDDAEERLEEAYGAQAAEFTPDSILKGTVISRHEDTVVVDVGYKSEGMVDVNEWQNPDEIVPGVEIEVLLKSVEDETGLITLSKREADRKKAWNRILDTYEEGDSVEGHGFKKIKGGLLVDIGVPVFLPASQIDVRRTGDLGEWIGAPIRAMIIKIDENRQNIVVSRRRLIEAEREDRKEKLLEILQEGDLVKGEVKNIADFGAFVDLGGIDGLLHITDMSWGRVNHPSEVVNIGEDIEVKVLKIDRDRERIALGLKQRGDSPWKEVEIKYPVGSRAEGEVVNIMSYGVFVKLEPGIEGLVHISEMSWTRRINHPSEVVAPGDMVEVVVLNIDKDKQEISLGMRQSQANPWDEVEVKYPPGTVIKGPVRNLTNYGAFVEIEEGIDGLLHVSDMSWTKKVDHPSKMVEKGDELECMVLSVDRDKKRVSLGLKQLEPDPWDEEIPEKFAPGEEFEGYVTKITNFGVFVELQEGLEGLLHVSELAEGQVDSPEDVVDAGDRLRVRVLRVDPEERKIGLTLEEVLEKGARVPEEEEAGDDEQPESDADEGGDEGDDAPEAEAASADDDSGDEQPEAESDDGDDGDDEPKAEADDGDDSAEDEGDDSGDEEPKAEADAGDDDAAEGDGDDSGDEQPKAEAEEDDSKES